MPAYKSLRSIVNTLSKIKENVECIRKQGEAQKYRAREDPEGDAQPEVRLPIGISEYYKTENADRPVKDRRDKIRLWLEIAGIVCAVAVAVATVSSLLILNGQLSEMQGQTKATRQQMRIDQRAWIFADDKGYEVKNGVPTFRITLQNSGKTAAKQYLAQFVVKRIKNTPNPPMEFSYEGIAHTGVKGGLIAPNSPPVTFEAVERTSDGKARQMSADEIKDLADGTDFLIVYGEIEYDDVFDRHHWTRFCEFTIVNTNKKGVYGERCTAYNDVDKNDTANDENMR